MEQNEKANLANQCEVELSERCLRFEEEAEKSNAQKFEQLITRTKDLYAKTMSTTLKNYWEIGDCICTFYKKDYKSAEFEKVAEGTGIDIFTLRKSFQFAQKYTSEDLEVLMNGNFTMSWNLISHNLKLKSRELLEIYLKSKSKAEFCDTITLLKNPNLGKKINKPKETELLQSEISKLTEEKDQYIKKFKNDFANLKKLIKRDPDSAIEIVKSLEKYIEEISLSSNVSN